MAKWKVRDVIIVINDKVEINLKNKILSNNDNTNINNINYNIDTNKIKNLVLNNENNENAKTKLNKSNSTFFRFLIYKFCCDKKNTYFGYIVNFVWK